MSSAPSATSWKILIILCGLEKLWNFLSLPEHFKHTTESSLVPKGIETNVGHIYKGAPVIEAHSLENRSSQFCNEK